MHQSTSHYRESKLEALAFLELLKPITWFPPMWAFACGAVSAGIPVIESLWLTFAGAVLAGPLVCGASQVVNDWFDREVDAINEPHRPIPSGRVPGKTGLWFAIFWSLLSLLISFAFGFWVAAATFIGLILAWAYSAPPLRLKRNGWFGNAAVGFSYEGLAWVTGAAVMLGGAMPDSRILLFALLYSIGAHGIMTLNDFKSIEGDRQIGLRSIPARYGTDMAAKLACVTMAVPQLIVIALLFSWLQPFHAVGVIVLLSAQLLAMVKLVRDPKKHAPWYNATGISLYVLGMMVSAFALRSIVSASVVSL